MLPRAAATFDFQNMVQLAEIIFVTQAGKPVHLRLDNCDSVKALACFCFDLFLRGVILLHGDANNVVRLDTFSMADLEHVCGLMRNAGIAVRFMLDDDCDDPPGPPVDLSELHNTPDAGRDIETYRVYLRPSPTTKLTLWFGLVRVFL